jgi:hypothetical protein
MIPGLPVQEVMAVEPICPGLPVQEAIAVEPISPGVPEQAVVVEPICPLSVLAILTATSLDIALHSFVSVTTTVYVPLACITAE